ncbi:hypothetical protein QTG56_25775 (plasmid) [Rossellomorea sp. AcN35-11]|nr:hypothetical protein [Rossellomorea aquimaris]WJV32026.1 hypothetical protein QTG56_25775 [Rossellomorea sp. AcN35-11]
MGKVIHLHNKPKKLKLGDRKENMKKKLEPIERQKQKIEELKKSIKKGR